MNTLHLSVVSSELLKAAAEHKGLTKLVMIETKLTEVPQFPSFTSIYFDLPQFTLIYLDLLQFILISLDSPQFTSIYLLPQFT